MKKENKALTKALAEKRDQAEARLTDQLERLDQLVSLECTQMRRAMHDKFGATVGVASEAALGSVEIVVRAAVTMMLTERKALAYKQKNGMLY